MTEINTMQTIADSVSAEVNKQRGANSEFNQQLQRFKDFKKTLDEAGVVYGDKYEIPLMSRIQGNLNSK
jgi:hypothetical protein